MLGPLGESKDICDTLTFSGPSRPVGEMTSTCEIQVQQLHKKPSFPVNSGNKNKCWAFQERKAHCGVGCLKNNDSVSRMNRTELERGPGKDPGWEFLVKDMESTYLGHTD